MVAFVLLVPVLFTCVREDWTATATPPDGVGEAVPLTVIKDPSRPPIHPPTQRLIRRGKDDPKVVEQQTGTKVYHRWTVDSMTDSFEMSPPIEWPPALTVMDDQTVALDLGTSIAPVRVDVFLNTNIDADGLPTDEPFLLSCNPLTGGGEECDLGIQNDRDPNANWEMKVPLPLDEGVYYIATSVIWLEDDPDTDDLVFITSWIFVVRRL